MCDVYWIDPQKNQINQLSMKSVLKTKKLY